MPDYSFIANPQQSSPMTAIGNVLGIAQKAQDLQTSRQQYQSNALSLQKQQALLQPQIEQGQAESQTAQTGAAASKYKLQADQAKPFYDEASALAQDPRMAAQKDGTFDQDGMVSALTEARQRLIDRGVPKATAEVQVSHLMNVAAQNPGQVLPALNTITRAGAGVGGQANVLNAPVSPVSAGGATEFKQLQPGAPGAVAPGSSMPNTVSPGGIETTEQGPDGNAYIVTRSPQGTILGTRPLAGGPQGGTGGGPGMPRFAPGDKDAIPTLQTEVINAKNTALAAPDIHNNTRGILSELDNVSATGVMGPTFQKINSALGGGLDWSSKEKAASSYDLVGKYLERNALQLAQGMGPHTNAGLDTVKAASGTVAYNSDAIRSIAKLVDANASGQEAYYPALQKAIAANPQRGVLAKQDFDQQWAQNYDPRIFQVRNALQSKDTAELARLKTQLGPQGMKEMQQKFQNLQALGVSGGP